MKIKDLYIPEELIEDIQNDYWIKGRFDSQVRNLLENYDINLELEIEYYN